MKNSTDSSIFLTRTGISEFTLRNEEQSTQPSGGDTGMNDHIERILLNAGFIVSDPLTFRHFLIDESECASCMVWLPRLLKSNFDSDEISAIEIDVVSDPEDEVASSEIYIMVETPLDVDAANIKLSAVNNDLISWGDKAMKINVVMNYS